MANSGHQQQQVMEGTRSVDEEQLKWLIQEEAMLLPDTNIAISGLAGRFPKSDSINEFEENLLHGVDMINDRDEARFTCGLWGLPPRAGRLKDISKFDCDFFGYTADRAHYIDYQLRILYEVVYESMLDAGVNPASLRGTRTGVFFGLHCNEFENAMADDPNFKSNGYYAQFAVKVAQYFDLRGLTVTFDAACASGFVGFHNAVEAIQEGVIDQAVVCSCNIPIHPTGSFIFLQMQMLSPTGYSRFLDSRADGYVKSEACVSVLLQSKDTALRNYCSVMATLTSVDGYKPEGITFPSDKSQENLIRQTKQLAGISTNHVEYLEAHGTGTPAGDPQEAQAIANVYIPQMDSSYWSSCDGSVMSSDEEEPLRPAGTSTFGEQEMSDDRVIGPLLVGSVKTNMGHSEATSGLCALAKVALMLENELIYRSLHYERPNNNIPALIRGQLQFVDQTRELRGKIIPLSCYGFGGSNVHAIVRANHRPAIEMDENPGLRDEAPHLVLMFGRSKQALNDFFDQMLNLNARNTRNCLSDDFLALLNALNAGKIDRLMDHRGFMVIDRRISPPKQLVREIRQCKIAALSEKKELLSDNQQDGRKFHLQEVCPRACHLILPGLGSQWPAMAKGLVTFEPFWSTIKRLGQLLEPFADRVDLLESLTSDQPQALETMCQKFVTIVAVQVALINLVKEQLKVSNLSNFVGHSLGEISCAYAAGIFDERESLLVAYWLGKVLDDNSSRLQGKMAAVDLSEAEVVELISDNKTTVQVCCVNGLKSVTVSGREADMNKFISQIKNQKGVLVKELDCNIALHNSKIMDAQIRQQLEDNLLNALNPGSDYRRDSTDWVGSFSNGRDLSRANAAYFADNFCSKVDFLAALQELPGDSIALELGPSSIFEFQIADLSNKFHYASLSGAKSASLEEQKVHLLSSIGRLYQAGVSMDLNSFYYSKELRSKKEPLFPVRRQTPSISSLMKWKHDQSFFVPRYPNQFSKSSAKSEVPVDIVQDRDKFLTGHCIEGRVLYPATGYLFLIWRAFSFLKHKVYDACFQAVEGDLVPIEFHNVRLLRAVILGTRVAQVYIHLEEGTGRFEIREGGSVVAEGYARSPEEEPEGLLHDQVRERIRAENLETSLNSDDIYKQFRVSGYDYGKTFQNIEAASEDGRYCKVRYNGHFVAFTDSILQSIFLAISEYAPSGGLFLPTRFEYVRFQPKIILNKIHQAKMVFDLIDGSLDTRVKRDIMTKIMERQSGKKVAQEIPQAGEVMATQQDGDGDDGAPLECIFETFCDPVTGIIITDGIEMRGINASPAPRRADNNDVMLESYQFVPDVEDPIVDEPLTCFEKQTSGYMQVCDSMAVDLLYQICGKDQLNLNGLTKNFSKLDRSQIDAYKNANLASVYGVQRMDEEGEAYDIKKNGQYMLLSVLDQLADHSNSKLIKKVLQDNRQHLMRDLIQNSFTSERFMRPLIETVIENTCSKKPRLKVLEVNVDDGLLQDQLQLLIKSIEPTLALDYSLAHPDINRLTESKLHSNGSSIKTFTLKDLSSLFNESQLKNLDVVVYKDVSCYSLPKQVVEKNGLTPIMTSLSGAARYVLLVLRQKLTIAERILLSLSEPELVGLTKQDMKEMNAGKTTTAADKIHRIDSILSARCKIMMKEAESNNMICLAKKSDPNGCAVLLFKTTKRQQQQQQQQTNQVNEQIEEMVDSGEGPLIRVTHGNEQQVAEWLEQLKSQFKKEKEEKDKEKKKQQVVWLCGVASKQKPVNGLVGMMQALRKELGSTQLRCFYDACTFKNCNEPITLEQIEQSKRFQEAKQRNLLWNCIDDEGNFGSFRHFMINSYMSYEDCRCENGGKELIPLSTMSPPIKAYVNNSVRGDLSSFTWFEAPLTHVEDSQIIKVAYAALNFRDIMLATGRLPLDAIPLSLALQDCQLGLEFAGVSMDGKRVAGMISSRAIASYVECRKSVSMLLEIPEWMGFEDAATLPVVYSTAIMALIIRGRMQRGESILIHAGSGGVGQAAIRLAAHHGLDIFTTVGSEEKRKFLLEEFPNCLTEERIFSSRDCRFEHQILRATRGRGVDLVLNSLADDKLQASIRCLADGGRFLEIGKYDLSVDTPLDLLRLDVNKTFHGILLDKLFDTRDACEQFRRQLDTIVEVLNDGLENGYVKPIRRTIFKSNQIEQAFRFMATGKHIGKVLIEIDPMNSKFVSLPIKCVPKLKLSSEKAYIVTGGLGGFGLELTKWLVREGARCILLTSRSGIKTGYQRATLRRLESCDKVSFLVVDQKVADCTNYEGARELCRLACEMAPNRQIGAVFHLAMVLKDTLLENMSAQDFELVCKPKVDTCEHLDRLTRENKQFQVDYFVAFSSVTSAKGNAGQANYAYANSCLERICERRRRQGQHGLAIQWGAIGDVGVAFENLGGNDVVIGGTIPQRIPSCLSTLTKMLCSPFAICLSVLPVKRGGDGSDGDRVDLVSAIMHVLGIKDSSKVSDQATLGELGLDSLMAVEIRQYIEREFDMTLNIQEIRALTIARIREINDTERPAGAKTEKQQRDAAIQNETPKAQSYGTKLLDREGQQQQEVTMDEQQTAELLQEPKAAVKDALQQAAIEVMLNKSMIANFVPKLELPEKDFCRLNYNHPSAHMTPVDSSRPIFFVPPIHGQFDKLEELCSGIRRPCIGLNWTRKLGQAKSLAEAVNLYLDVLRHADWQVDFAAGLPAADKELEANQERVVDVVGYSYGATVAFEMMVHLHRLRQRAARQIANGLAESDQLTGGLRAGKLILLDGSPRQIELGSQYLSHLTSRRPLRLSEKVDELLMVFVMAHTRDKKVDYVELQQSLATIELNQKTDFASHRLANILSLEDSSWLHRAGEANSKRLALSHAMEAFCRRYELISKYKAKCSLPDECTLIRAKELYLSTADHRTYNEDLGLKSVVKGRVNLFVMEGNHETFLEGNRREIAELITRHCV